MKAILVIIFGFYLMQHIYAETTSIQNIELLIPKESVWPILCKKLNRTNNLKVIQNNQLDRLHYYCKLEKKLNSSEGVIISKLIRGEAINDVEHHQLFNQYLKLKKIRSLTNGRSLALNPLNELLLKNAKRAPAMISIDLDQNHQINYHFQKPLTNSLQLTEPIALHYYVLEKYQQSSLNTVNLSPYQQKIHLLKVEIDLTQALLKVANNPFVIEQQQSKLNQMLKAQDLLINF